jgi:hypothetical protein
MFTQPNKPFRIRSARRATIEMLELRRLLSVGSFANDQDIGSPTPAGAASYSNGTYTISGGGSDIGGTSDQFHFTSNPLTGDGNAIANVTTLSNTDANAKAGVMIRNGAGASAAFAGIFVTPSSGISFVVRTTDGGTAGQTITPFFHAPKFLRLSRAGSQISGFYSADALTWTQLGAAQTITLGGGALVGLAVTSHNVSALATSTFTNVSMLPAGWSDSDVGSPALPGSAIYNGTANSFTVTGGGIDIGGNADQFNFNYRNITGDTTITARVDSLMNTDPAAKAGVMIRSDLSAGPISAGTFLTAQNGIAFTWRSTAGASASTFTIPNVSAPAWVRISQNANTFIASYSLDALTWNSIGSPQTITMPSATALGGLAVTSHNAAALGSSTFSAISIVPTPWSNRDIGTPSLSGSAIYDAPGDTYTLFGSGSDIYGTADQFNFASRTMSGDGAVAAYVNSISNTDPFAKAGVMFRADDSASSAFAGVFVTPQSGIVFEWRPGAGAEAQSAITVPPGGPAFAAVSLKLTRSGNTFGPFYSTDGITWNLVATSQPVIMPATVSVGLAVTSHNPAALCMATFSSVGVGSTLAPAAGIYSTDDQLFLNDLEMREAQFFYNETNASTGLIPDNSNANGGSPSAASSIASIGFGLSSLTIADARGWLSHAAAYQRALTTLNFLYNTAASVQGFFYHFLNPTTGARSPGSELSSVDTAELMAGVVNVGQYWAGTAVQTVATNLFNRVTWPFMQKPNLQFYGAWSPESGFSGGYVDFSEAVVLYLLGLGSPTHPVARDSWKSWTRMPAVNYGSYHFITASDAALFTVQYPQAWFDLRGLADYTGLNYYENAKTATLAQRQWMTDISPSFPDYGPNMWGLTASDGAGGYTVWGGPPPFGPINGTVVPTGPGGSLAFTPRLSLDALKYMKQTFGASVYKKYGLVDAFNPLTNWTSSLVLGIDLGMTLIAAENARTNLVWNVFNQNSVARQAIASAFPSVSPQLFSAASRKAANLDLSVNLDSPITVENRSGGLTNLLLNFGANIVKGASFSIALSTPTGPAIGSVVSSSASGSTLSITFSGVADEQNLIITINDLRHFSDTAGGNYTVNIGTLLADTNQDGRVNAMDFNILATHFGGSGKNSSQGDFNVDGIVNSTDFNLLAISFGNTIAIASPSLPNSVAAGSHVLIEGDPESPLLWVNAKATQASPLQIANRLFGSNDDRDQPALLEF